MLLRIDLGQSGRKPLNFFPPNIPTPPLVQHPNVIVMASATSIRVICHLSSLLVTETRSLLPPPIDDIGASTSSNSSHFCMSHACVMCNNLYLGPITSSKF